MAGTRSVRRAHSTTPCCGMEVSAHDGLREIKCTGCGQYYMTYTQKGVISFKPDPRCVCGELFTQHAQPTKTEPKRFCWKPGCKCADFEEVKGT